MEEHFKNKLKKYRVEWDKEGLWDELAPQLPQKETKRKSWLLLFLLPLLVIPFCRPSQHLQVATAKEDGGDEIVQVSRQQDALGHPQPNQLEHTNQSSLGDVPSEETAKIDHAQVGTPVHGEGGGNAILAKESTPVRSSLPPITKPFFGERPPEQANKTASTVVLTKSIERNAISLGELETSPVPMSTIEENNLEFINERKEDSVNRRAPFLPRVDYSVLYTGSMPREDFVILPSGSCEASDEKSGIFAGLSLGGGTVSRRNTYLTDDLLRREQQRTNSESLVPRCVATAQLDLGYKVNERWSVSVGVSHQLIYEQFEFDAIYSSDTLYQSFNRARFLIDRSGDTLFFAGEGAFVEQQSRSVRHNNFLQTYQLPVQIFYTRQYQKWGFTAGGGINWAINSNYKGRINEVPNNIVDDPEYQLRSRWGYLLSVGTQFQLTRRQSLFARLAYQKSPRWQYDDVSYRYSTCQLQIGTQILIK